MKKNPLILMLSFVFTAILSFSQPGSADTSFGTNGKLVKPKGVAGTFEHCMALQPDGKILVAGCVPNGVNIDFLLVRYKPNGALDKSFGSDGKVITDFGGDEKANAVAVQADGKIVVAGDSDYYFALTRYDPDGSLDSSFGINGKVITFFDYYHNQSGEIHSLAIQPDGKIVAAGYAFDWADEKVFALARYKIDGSPDSSFDEDGKVITFVSFDDVAYSVAIQRDGKILAAGTGSFYEIALAQYKPNGKLDNNFGAGGIVTADLGGLGGWCDAYSIAVQADRKILLAGAILAEQASNTDFIVQRYKPNGSLDSSFGNNGNVVTDFNSNNDYANAVVLQPNGKVVVAGYSRDTVSDFALARYTQRGRLDKTFGIKGKVVMDIGGDDYCFSAVLQPDGKIVAAGSSGNKLALARYYGDGVPLSANNTSLDMISGRRNDLKIFPNPVQSVLTVELKASDKTQKQISLYDMSGKLLITKLVNNTAQIDVRQLTSGIYVLKLVDENNRELCSTKVVKE